MSKKIRVVRLLDNVVYKVVLNVGIADDIKIGDKFLLYEIDPNPIIDPETNENLGELEIVKGCGKVISVQDKMCIIESSTVKLRKKPSNIVNMLANNTDYYEDMPFDNPKIGDYAKKVD